MPPAVRARYDKLSADQKQQLSDDVNLDVARIPILEYDNKFPDYIEFTNPISITPDLTQHQFMDATKLVIHAVMTTEASFDAHFNKLGERLGKP